MLDYLKQIISDQFHASLNMLDACVTSCPEEHWDGRIGNAAFWRMAYHTLFFLDMYLSEDEPTFKPRDFHQKDMHSFNDKEHPPGVTYDRDVIIEYIHHCRVKISETINSETEQSLERPSGFPWYPMSRGEHHLANIRHMQHHVGQMAAYLRSNTGHGIDWTGKAPE